MVSRQNYIAIVIMFVILLFLFQFTGVIKERLNEYGTNEYEEAAATALSGKNSYKPGAEDVNVQTDTVYIGDASDDMASVIRWWCTYSKRELTQYASLGDYKPSPENLPRLLVIDGKTVDSAEEVDRLVGLAAGGVNLVFAELPDISTIQENESLRVLLGIRHVIAKQTTFNGVHLFQGFLLGGEEIYKAAEGEERWDFGETMPWYVPGSGTKTYMVGMVSDEVLEKSVPEDIKEQYYSMEKDTVKNTLLPAIIWRSSTENARIFCVNAPFLSEMWGIGILSAMMAELSSYEIYPVINAQNLVLADYPAFVSENSEEMNRRYSQSAQAIYREIIWPSLASLIGHTGARVTAMITPQFDYEDGIEPEGSEVEFYFKLLKEKHGEAGLSSSSVSDISVLEKLAVDKGFWQETVPEYTFLSIYLKEEQIQEVFSEALFPNLRTVVIKAEEGTLGPIVSYVNDAVTKQQATSSGSKHTFLDDLKVKSIETALGYSNIVLDFKSISYPRTEEDSWERIVSRITSNLSTYWKPYRKFDTATLAESDTRIRRFLALDYSQQREEERIILNIENFEEEAWFLLRISGEEIKSVRGGSYTKIQDGVYLIAVAGEQVVIEVKPKGGLYYKLELR